jgi:hypothetical protein
VGTVLLGDVTDAVLGIRRDVRVVQDLVQETLGLTLVPTKETGEIVDALLFCNVLKQDDCQQQNGDDDQNKQDPFVHDFVV